MKKPFSVFLLLCCAFAVQHANAQQFEPKWGGTAYALEIIDADTVVIPLEKVNSQIKKTNGFVEKVLCTIQGPKSTTHLSPNKPIILLVKWKDNETDPFSFIQVIKFDSKKKERSTELAKKGLSKIIENIMQLIPFEAESYGKSSYILTLPPLAGEYGVRILNPDALDEKAPVFHCFGVY